MQQVTVDMYDSDVASIAANTAYTTDSQVRYIPEDAKRVRVRARATIAAAESEDNCVVFLKAGPASNDLSTNRFQHRTSLDQNGEAKGVPQNIDDLAGNWIAVDELYNEADGNPITAVNAELTYWI
jgi:hypothetical protein